jgi:hypothetical protein
MATQGTYTITDSGSHIVLTHSGGDIRNIPKNNLTIVEKAGTTSGSKVYMNWPSGDYPNALDNIYLDYTEVTAPVVASNAELMAVLLGFAKEVDINVDVTSTSNDGGFYIGKSATATDGDFTVAWASATTLTLGGYPAGISAMTATDIEVVRHISAAGIVTRTYSRDDATMSIAGDVLTVVGAAFVNTDTFVIFTNIPRASSSGAGGAGGGSIVYTNAAGDFTATPGDGVKTVTITGLPFTLEAKHVAGGSIKKIDTNDIATDVPLTDVAVAAGVITLADADNFATTDELYVTLIGPDKWYDRAQDSAKQLVQNPEWAHYTDVEHITDDSDATVDQHYSPEIFMDGQLHLPIWLQLLVLIGLTFLLIFLVPQL